MLSVESFTVTRVDDGLRAEITGGVETLFLGLIGIEDLGVTRSAEVQVGLTKIELALVLDTTGSMGATPSGQSQTKLESLQNAAKRMVTTLDALSPNDSMIEIGIVPGSVSEAAAELIGPNKGFFLCSQPGSAIM